eukprot:GHVU01089037.1.p2 GENE.GHVU01089037.1~~GHVU01089037.1.p2  ORF type:complete len:250 (-),score=26.20 GHVU01089037.1:50-799(-)
MSIRVMSKVWESYPGGGSELLALLALADWSDDNGRCYPSMASISKKVRLKPRQAQRVVHQLIEAGFVSVIGNEFGGKPGATRQYRINLSSLTGVAHDTGVAEDVDGCHGRRETGVAHDTQTVIEPPRTVSKSNSVELLVGTTQDKKKIPPCPHQEIVDAYHEALPASPQIRDWTKARAAHLQARWREEPKRQNVDWWRRLFGYVAESDFLTGKSATPGRKPFTASLDWLLKPENFAKVREGRYHDGGEA